MARKTFNGRIVHKHDTAENWNKATNFIPKQGEIIVYDIDNTYDYERMKVGDGSTTVVNLPFILNNITNEEINEICNSENGFVIDDFGNVILSNFSISEDGSVTV